MRIYGSIEEFSAKNPIVTIGMFDGVHSGHRAILSQLEKIKQREGGESVLLTFWPHPRVYFGKTEGFNLLTTLDEKMELLEKNGLDVCLVLPFSQELSELSPEDYIYKILYKGIGAKTVVIGYDHKYGRAGEGTFELMKQCGKQYGFSVEQISAYSVDSETVSSTKIRNCLSEGNIERVNQMLSYEYFFTGKVVAGRKIGRTIGFPTANLQSEFSYKKLPEKGVYVGMAYVENKIYKAVINIGNNPTICENLPLSVEVHLIDFSEEIYDKNVRVTFLKKLRDEQHFESLDELKSAIKKDVVKAKMILKNHIFVGQF
ncbi:MAG: bifunctional riboflavin kinase/FAD synthetase [Bacteroidales bacterium]|nr:bifunctional riboflavin kinase/FAD synthetase [Bacteroidales bacterium]